MTPDDPRHGTPAGYQAHRAEKSETCFHCRVAWAHYANHVARQKAYGRWQPWVDAEPAREHARQLTREGTPYRQIAKAAGVNPRRVSALLYGRNGGPPTQKIRPDFSAAILSVQPAPTRVPSLGAARRLRALVAIGHSQRALATELGITPSRVDQLVNLHRDTIMRETHDRIAELYDRLSNHIPQPATRTERQVFTRARADAKRRGWAPPLAWDNIDDPNEEPTGHIHCSAPGCIGEIKARGLCRSHYDGDRNHRPDDHDPHRVRRILNGDWTLPCSPRDKTEVCREWVGSGRSLSDLERLTGWRTTRYFKVSDAA